MVSVFIETSIALLFLAILPHEEVQKAVNCHFELSDMDYKTFTLPSFFPLSQSHSIGITRIRRPVAYSDSVGGWVVCLTHILV